MSRKVPNGSCPVNLWISDSVITGSNDISNNSHDALGNTLESLSAYISHRGFPQLVTNNISVT